MFELSIAEAGQMIRSGEVTSKDLTEDALSRIESLDGQLDSFITVTGDRARADAEKADADFAAGIDKGPMQGIPYALKDIYMTSGILSTCHSKLLVDNVPDHDSVVGTKLAEAGGVLLGKTATHEFAYGGPSFDLPFPPARNPWNRDCMPGGSSSGSGAAVAAGLCRMAMGSDTGGSIRGPASYCGTAGHKPTYGLVSRRGVFPLSFTLDHAGPLAWTVGDCAATMQVIQGFDPLDPASANVPEIDFLSGLGDGVEGMKFAVPRDFFDGKPGMDPEMLAAFDASIEKLKALGATVDVVKLPDFELFNATGRIILTAEAFGIHEKDLIERPLDFGQYAMMRMYAGAGLTAMDLVQALRARRVLSKAVNKSVLGSYDAIITALAFTTAPRFDEMSRDEPPSYTLQSMPFNVTGNPALAMPTGLSSDGLPLSLQIVGRPFEDAKVLQIGEALEKATGLIATRPPLAA
ncbi:amidase [Oceanicola sp. 22II-s10i]|nr:amidase [Oceanicola sp. 22II-s10i]